MRMTLRRWDARREEGVTAVIVALALIAIFGMTALAVDGGGMLAMRRRLVNTSDSAALAAALAYATTENGAQCNVTDTPAQTEADLAGTQNVSTASRIFYQCTPSGTISGQVTVRYSTPYTLYFAPVLGFPKDRPVTAIATAKFGAAGTGQPPPVMLRDQMLRSCKDANGNPAPIDPPPANATPSNPYTCGMYMNNSNYQGSLGDAQWAWMNLNTWGIQPGSNCQNAGANQIQNWITNAYPTTLGINSNGPTYVCTENGLAEPQSSALGSLVGQIRWFPVNCEQQTITAPCQAPHGQVNSSWVVCAPPCTPYAYDIVGFSPLRIMAVCTHQDTSSDANCPGGWAAAIGVTGQTGLPLSFCGFTGGTGQTPATPISLENISGTGCPGGAYQNIQLRDINNGSPDLNIYTVKGNNPPVVLTRCFNPSFTGCPTASYYYTDTGPNLHECPCTLVSWNPSYSVPSGAKLHIDFNWYRQSVAGVPGYCERYGNDSDPNAWCLYVQYEGPQFNGQGAGGNGYDFGARGVSLIG